MERTEREPVWVPIRKTLNKIPGGRIIIPLIFGSIVVSICDAFGVRDPWAMVGSPAMYLFSSRGITIVLGFMLFFTGTQIDVRKMKPMLTRGFPLLLLRLGIAYALSYLFYFFTKGSENMWIGISFVTFTACLTSTNAGMFMGLVNPYGDDADYSYFGVLLLTALPAFPMLLIQGSQGGNIDYMSMISILLPILFGMLLGNLDPNIRKVFKHGNDVVIPFLGFQFGSAIKIMTAMRMIPQGLFLIACWYLIGVLPSFLLEKYVMKRPGYISVACSAMAGVALSIPELVNERELFNNFNATALDNSLASLALVLVVTSILCPILTEFSNKIYYKNHKEDCKNRFPTLGEYVEKLSDRDSMYQMKRRVAKARKFIRKEMLTSMSDEERTDFLLQEKAEKMLKKVTFNKTLKSLPKNKRAEFIRRRKMDREDEELFEEGVFSFMVEKRNSALIRANLLSGGAKIDFYNKHPILDGERKKLSKELEKEKTGLVLHPLTPHDLAYRTIEAYDIAKSEYIERK